MIEHATQTLSLTDGRRKIYGVRVIGGSLRFMAGELNPVQTRSELDFNASMATLSSTRPINMDLLNSSAAANDPVLYEAKPLQFPCLVFPVDVIARLWNRQDFSSLCLNQSLRFFASVTMPRSRGIPRRGGRSGIGARPSQSAPQQVAPIALVPPSSPLSDQERIIPNNSYQSSRFVFQSRLNRPVVTVNFTVFVSEEESNPLSSTPPASSNSQDDSILLGDMIGLVYHADCIYEDAPVQEGPQQPDPAKEDDKVCEPSQGAIGYLHLVIDSGGEPLLDEDGFVTWVASPSQTKKDKQASPSHAN